MTFESAFNHFLQISHSRKRTVRVDTSVIMINRNGAGELAAVLASCRQALEHARTSLRPFEFVLIDNGSKDASVEIAKRELDDALFPWRVIVEPTAGVNSARNRGLAEAQGD